MDDYDDGDYLDMDNDWFYVEDEFDLADELAENAIPDPGYMGTAAEIAMESYDFDFYGYNEDLEYGEDPYWDNSGPRPAPFSRNQAVDSAKPGSKRKRNLEHMSSSKKQKLAPTEPDLQPVLFRSRELSSGSQVSPDMSTRSTFALLPDWRERYKNEHGGAASKRMPAAMARAAYEEEPEDDDQAINESEQVEGAEEDDWESEDDEEESGLDIDPESLKSILAEKLAEAGITGDEQGAFMQSINEMLTGDGKGEAAAELLEKAQSSTARKRKADSAVGLEPEQKKKMNKGRNGQGNE